jgi:hypothetical protein
VLCLIVAVPARAETDLERMGRELGGGALMGVLLTGVVTGGEARAGLGLGWPMAISAGLSWSLGVGVGAGANSHGQRVWPGVIGSAIGLTFAVAATALANSNTQRLIIGIPLTVVLPLVFSVIANEWARGS